MNKNIQFITITNLGYIPLTINCYESLLCNNVNKELTSFCLDENAYNILKNKNYPCVLFNNNIPNSEELSRYKDKNWKKMMYLKMKIIYENLLKYDYVCVTDGDIVFENKDFLKFAIEYLCKKKVDIVYQNNGLSNKCKLMCAGFAVIKSTNTTKKLYNASLDEKFSSEQEYLRNKIKRLRCNISLLPLQLYPNGNYYYKHYKNIAPYLIHFNWVSSQKKIRKLKTFNKWYEEFNIEKIPIDKRIDVTEKTINLISQGHLHIEKHKYNTVFSDFAFKKKKIFYIKYVSDSRKKCLFFKEHQDCKVDLTKEGLIEAYYIQNFEIDV